MTPEQVFEFVRNSIVREAILAIVPRINVAYQAAWQAALAEYPDEDFRADALPDMRRSKVEQELSQAGTKLAAAFPERVAVIRGRSGRWHRTELYFDRLKVTQCRLAGRDGRPPKALHRQEYAKGNEQFQKSLFDDPPDQKHFPPVLPCFGMLVHGGRSHDGPEFLLIKITEKDGNRFIGGEFDLLAEWRRLVKRVEREDIDDEFGPEWRDQDNVGG